MSRSKCNVERIVVANPNPRVVPTSRTVRIIKRKDAASMKVSRAELVDLTCDKPCHYIPPLRAAFRFPSPDTSNRNRYVVSIDKHTLISN